MKTRLRWASSCCWQTQKCDRRNHRSRKVPFAVLLSHIFSNITQSQLYMRRVYIVCHLALFPIYIHKRHTHCTCPNDGPQPIYKPHELEHANIFFILIFKCVAHKRRAAARRRIVGAACLSVWTATSVAHAYIVYVTRFDLFRPASAHTAPAASRRRRRIIVQSNLFCTCNTARRTLELLSKFRVEPTANIGRLN